MKSSKKADQVIEALRDLNFPQRGHNVCKHADEDFPVEVVVTNINIPMVADCRWIAELYKCDFKLDNLFNIGVFSF